MQPAATPRWAPWIVCAGLLANAAFVGSPLYRAGVLATLDMDLANHVRHTHEYTLALREGQLPPLVAPTLNGRLRYPLFQFYSGTAYTLPGLLGLAWLDAYKGLKVSVVALSFLAGLALFRVLRASLGSGRAAYLGASTFQLFGFAAVDLYTRGGYPEWASLHLAALVLWALCGLADASAAPASGRRVVGRLWAAVLALVAFIPCHPSQTVYTGLTVLVLAGAYSLDRLPWRALVRAVGLTALAGLLGVLLTAWFWLPIFADYSHLRVTGHLPFVQAAGQPWVLFWPWFRTGFAAGWAPQVGPHLLAAAVLAGLAALRGPRRAQSLASAALVLLFCWLVLLPHLNERYPAWQRVYQAVLPFVRPMQWSYRFLMPCALAGAVAAGLAFRRAEGWLGEARSKALLAAGLVFLAAHGFPYFHLSRVYAEPGRHFHDLTLEEVLADGFDSRNVTLGYALHGLDYRALQWTDGGTLRLGQDFLLPFEGVPFTAGLATDPHPSLSVSLNGKPLATRRVRAEDGLPMTAFDVPFPAGCCEEMRVRFDAPQGPVRVASVAFRPLGEDRWLRLPASCEPWPAAPRWPGGRVFYRVVARQEGDYQLPICTSAGLRVRVNGVPAALVSRADRYLVTAHLPAGENVVEVRSAVAPGGVWLGVLGAALLGLASWGLRPRRPAIPAAAPAAVPLARAG